ncbi:MAG: phosphoribosylaminoimidazolesuccinocarboxamide synthase [Spirochaetales bacterium]|nr:phosphoribosylaminoimidazolesuccinocarboxamide synthase [Spirochaetales bacterium]
MNRDLLLKALGSVFEGIPEDKAGGRPFYKGKVRDIIDIGDKLIISTSDRISAFDHVLATIPFKGQVLNQMALFWFSSTADILKNHIVKEITPRTVLVDKCEVLPVEVIVRGYLTGSAWRDYEKGNPVSGIELPAGMKMDQAFDTPLITPSTKAEQGEHDMPISSAEIVSRSLVAADVWAQVEEKALSLFARGTEIARKQGLILVDTKYEFGLKDGELRIVDEIHTPDSSRYWYADTYRELFDKGVEQRKVDKEFLRKWLMDRGWMGDGLPPVIPDDTRIDVAEKYIAAYEGITGRTFYGELSTAESEMAAIGEFLP